MFLLQSLKMPDSSLHLNFKYKLTDSDQEMISLTEDIMLSWIHDIEDVFIDVQNDRYVVLQSSKVSLLF